MSRKRKNKLKRSKKTRRRIEGSITIVESDQGTVVYADEALKKAVNLLTKKPIFNGNEVGQIENVKYDPKRKEILVTVSFEKTDKKKGG